MEDSCVVGLSTSVSRKSPFQMISVKEGVDLVLTNTSVLDEIQIPFENCIGYVASRDIYCPYPFPIRPTSIMDGYAVSAPLVPGVYKIVESVFAGSMPSQSVECSEVSYITTGGILPPGSNAVVKIEDTEAYQHEGKCDNFVKILVSVKPGCNVREIGSDIQAGDMIIAKGKVLDHVDIGLLATIGVCFVYVFRKPKIGVLSTGNELVEPSETPLDGQIRDSNRISIISSLKASGYDIIDLGIMRDDMIPSEVDAYFLSLCSYIDIVISSGGVSMGKADFVKPSLARIGDIHFGRLLMKPGKPTTFATIRNDCGKRSMLFFALPGNPVSCLVSKILLVDTALKKMQGFEDERCRSQSMEAELYGRSHNLGIPMDPERPEYHRGIVEWSFEGPKWIVRSTDEMNQRSSRLLSAQEANALLVIPQGKGTLLYGSSVSILFLSHLPFNCTNFSSFTYSEAQRAKVVVEIPKVGQVTQDTSRNSKAHINETNGVDPVTMELYESFNNILHQNNKLKVTTRLSNESLRDWRNIRVALLTISDRASQNIYPDESGPEMERLLLEMSRSIDTRSEQKYPLNFEIVERALVPDEIDQIRHSVEQWSDKSFHDIDMILTSGGTGFGPRDFTPEALEPILHRKAPGIAQALLQEGLKHTPLAVLSRPVAGVRNSTFICTLPGSVKAVRENIEALRLLLPRILELLKSS